MKETDMQEPLTGALPQDPAEGAQGAEAAEHTAQGEETPAKKGAGKKGIKAWWQAHKPTKRRLIQVYVALLTNANIKGFALGSLYKGSTKSMCVPGLNCYSCPGAVGACPLGALQNAFAQSGTRTPYYVIGIILLFGLLFARSVCGFLCPVGLGQELLYKIKTPKLKKSRVTRVLSYFKYVLLAVFVIGIPLIYGVYGMTAIPAFCKYICPAGTLGGAIALLMNPANAEYYPMLGVLFTWKFCLMVAIVVGCIFVYRGFCRFLCPLGAIYGFFNKFALLGVKVDAEKCTDCGLCVSRCKMDVRKVGDHECINCGECIGVCPTKAIRWKGSKLFVHGASEAPAEEERPLSALLSSPAKEEPAMPQQTDFAGTVSETAPKKQKWTVKIGRRGKLAVRICALSVAGAVLAGALVYYNFIDKVPVSAAEKSYMMCIDGPAPSLAFTVREEGKEAGEAEILSGTGEEYDPFVLRSLSGTYDVDLSGGKVYFLFTVREKTAYTVEGTDALRLTVFYYSGKDRKTVYEYGGETSFTITPFGNAVGDLCFDFTLPYADGSGELTLSSFRGKTVVINFWGTWCGPCVKELPDFERAKEAFGDRVEVVAIHSAYAPEDIYAFLSAKTDNGKLWKDWAVHFVNDRGEGLSGEVYNLLGGKDSYPTTLILDGEGVVRFVRVGSLPYDVLMQQLQAIV